MPSDRVRRCPAAWSVLLACWGWLLFAGCAPSQKTYLSRFAGEVVSNPSEDPVARGSRESVVAVEALDGQSKLIGFGSGIVVGGSSVATCLHVMEAASRIRIVLPDGSRLEATGILGTDPLNDLAVIQSAEPLAGCRPIPFREGPAAVGEEATAIASPRVLAVKATRGKVLSVPEPHSGSYQRNLVVSAPASPGFSGGPVLDKEGRLLGISSEIQTRNGRSELAAIPVSVVAPLVGRHAVPLSTWRERTLQPTPAAAILVSRAEQLAASRPAEALALVEAALRQSPHYARAWTRKAALLLRQGNPLGAEQALAKVESLVPGDEAVRIERFLCFLLAGRFDDAKGRIERLVAENPSNATYKLLLASLHWSANDAVSALQAGKASVAVAPGDPRCRLHYGHLLLQMSCLEGAAAELREATRLAPRDPRTWYHSGLCAWRQGRTNEAVQDLRHSLALPGHPFPGHARYLVFVSLWDADLRNEARLEFQRFLETGIVPPDSFPVVVPGQVRKEIASIPARDWAAPETHRKIAALVQNPHHRDLLQSVLGVCVRRNPTDFESRVLLGQMALLGRDLAFASECALRALAAKPNFSHAHWILGVCRYAQGDTTAGRIHLEKSLQLDPRSGLVLATMAEIEDKEGRFEAAKRLREAERGLRGKESFAEQFRKLIPEGVVPCPDAHESVSR